METTDSISIYQMCPFLNTTYVPLRNTGISVESFSLHIELISWGHCIIFWYISMRQNCLISRKHAIFRNRVLWFHLYKAAKAVPDTIVAYTKVSTWWTIKNDGETAFICFALYYSYSAGHKCIWWKNWFHKLPCQVSLRFYHEYPMRKRTIVISALLVSCNSLFELVFS